MLTFIVYKNKNLINEYMYTYIDWIQYMHE
jgi:hypothetical protein